MTSARCAAVEALSMIAISASLYLIWKVATITQQHERVYERQINGHHKNVWRPNEAEAQTKLLDTRIDNEQATGAALVSVKLPPD